MKVMMNFASKLLARLTRDEEGASAVEYAILAAVMGLAISTAAGTLGDDIGTAFTTIAGYLS